MRATTPVLLLVAMLATGQGRLRPPANVGCDRNQLTSYEGLVKQYTHEAARVSIEIQTDENTVERVVVSMKDGSALEGRLLWNGEPFQPRHWKELEERPGKLRSGTRVVAWVCEGGKPPLLDWRPPSR
jgi:hypothetical protein